MNSTSSVQGRIVAVVVWLAASAAACSTPQSALNAAGRESAEVAGLFWWMSAGAVVIWLLMMVATAYCIAGPRPRDLSRSAAWLIVGGGVVLPTALLVPLLAAGLQPLARRTPPDEPSPLTIEVTGEQWWWRVRYDSRRHGVVDSANEIHLPRGQKVGVRLHSDDVIHAFWIPSLAGKVDMIPGRVTTLVLEPTNTGRYRGVCAEYCGTSHALMAFDVEVMEPETFDAWLAREAGEASAVPPAQRRGEDAFLEHGCAACHAIRGTTAAGTSGPDLTHVGGRRSLAAATTANGPAEMRRWLAHADTIKPGTQMPAFAMLAGDVLDDLTDYLGALQ